MAEGTGSSAAAHTPVARGPLPLAGVRVLDLSRVLAGPFCCQILGDLGADVVKIERPGGGDDTRHWGPPFVDAPGDGVGEGRTTGPSAYYLSCNRNKRGIALDLEHDAAREVLDALIRRADVLVENFLPHSLAKLGLQSERLHELNPHLVTVSISGFGRTGPLADEPGYDFVIQALAGLMSITGEPGGAPMKVGVAISDVLTGLFAAISALSGLLGRDHGQGGATCDLALADCTLAGLVNVVQSVLVTGERPRRYGNAHPQIVPYDVFATADGHLVLAVGNDRQWQRFCRASGRADLAGDPRYVTNPDRVRNRESLVAALQREFTARTTAEWRQRLAAADVPHAPVVPIDESVAAPQTTARDMIHTVTDGQGCTFQLLGSPIHWSGLPSLPVAAPPALGEHTDIVLRDWLGYEDSQIARLRDCGAIA